jgi:PAS domain S-box-containing protein
MTGKDDAMNSASASDTEKTKLPDPVAQSAGVPSPDAGYPDDSAMQSLRKRAEVMVREWEEAEAGMIRPRSQEETAHLLHELRTHQIELEMQNEELRRAHEELDVARSLYFDLYDMAPAGYCTLNEQGLIVSANLAASNQMGLARNALVNQPISRFIVYEDQDQYYLHRRQLIASGELQQFDLRMTGGGPPLWVHVTASLSQDSEGHPEHRLVLLDISKRKTVENALAESELRYRSTIQTAIDGYWAVDTEGRILDVNDAYCRMIGYSMEELLGMHVSDVEVLESQVDVKDHIARVIASGGDRFETRHRRKDGSEFPVEISLQQNEGEAVSMIAFMRDITKRKEAEAELRESMEKYQEAKDRAEKSEALKDSFIANISHEVRTPLNIILGFTNTIAEKYASLIPAADHRFFESVQRGGERLMRTVDMILSVSRLQSGEFTLKPTDVDIPKLVRKIVADHQPFAQEKGLALSATDECGTAVIVADEYCITEAVSNLVHNAIKFTTHGGVELRVYFDHDGLLCISCGDSGIGITEEYLPILFSRYSQEQIGYSRPYQGLGLGMALVKEYLVLNNASISVVSRKGVGTTFTIVFQREGLTRIATGTPVDAGSPARWEEATPAMPGGAELPTVLVVEDDEMTLEFMEVILEAEYSVLSARTGPQAWELLRTAPVDIVLMDISLAGVQTGVELTKEIRASAEFAHLPIIAVTAHAYDRDRENCLTAGCDDFLRKPVSSAVLLDRMGRLLVHRT